MSQNSLRTVVENSHSRVQELNNARGFYHSYEPQDELKLSECGLRLALSKCVQRFNRSRNQKINGGKMGNQKQQQQGQGKRNSQQQDQDVDKNENSQQDSQKWQQPEQQAPRSGNKNQSSGSRQAPTDSE